MRTVVADETVAPRYSGYSAWRGITSVPVDLNGAAGESVGHGRRFGIAPLADGRVYWFAVANMPDNAVFADEKATVEQMFTGWHSPIAELIDGTDAEAVHRTPISDLSRRLAGFHRGRVVLIGDAAHAMTPNLGQGGGQALEDAATLAALVTPLLERGDEVAPTAVDDVLHRYDGLRRPRAQAIARKSRLMGRVFQLESPLLARLRDAVFSAVPARFVAAQAASVQKWSPPALPR
jgi:2-polyprenyl-6-methoxyphenol hydroxylase-like FAD-dependent oxidoreductase